ncbi:hypothetical protein D3C81_983390 [compost metagenome]
MGHADGEHQEWHEDRIRIQLIAKLGNQAELPEHRNAGTDEHQGGTAHAARPAEDDQRCDDRGEPEIENHQVEAVEQVADHLGEADDAHLDIGIALRAGELRADVFQLLGKLPVVDRLAGSRVLVE